MLFCLSLDFLGNKQAFIINNIHSFIESVNNNSLNAQSVPHCIWAFALERRKVKNLSPFFQTLLEHPNSKMKPNISFNTKLLKASVLCSMGSDNYKTIGNHPVFQTTYTQG